MEAVISMRGVVRRFAGTTALDGFDLEVPRGSLTALVGPNGAGKTTAMRIAIGLLATDGGEARVLGLDPWTMPKETRRRIGYVSEQDFAFPELDFVGAARFLSCFHPTWDASYLDELAKTLRVPRDRSYATLSRGEQRKFHLALALAPRPELVLLDDPAQGLDVMTRREFMRGILPLLQDSRCTVLFSTHVLSDVERIADRVAFVADGRVVLHDELDRVKQRVRQIVARGEVDVAPRGTLAERRDAREVAWTVLDADETELAGMRARGVVLEERPLPFEDLFIDVIEAARRTREVARA